MTSVRHGKMRQTVIVMVLVGLLVCAGGMSPGASLASDVYHASDTDVPIEPVGEWVFSIITVDDAPECAVVTGIDVGFQAVHTYAGDLAVELTDQDVAGAFRLWDFEGEDSDNPTRTISGITAFNGMPVNRSWVLWAADGAEGDIGYIDSWWIRIHYQIGEQSYSIYAAAVQAVSGTVDLDGDGYFEEYSFNIALDADVSCGSASINARVINNDTGEFWEFAEPFTITGDSGDDAIAMNLTQLDFGGRLNQPTDLDFTVEIWDPTFTTLLASEAVVAGEPFKSAVIPAQYAIYATDIANFSGTDTDADGYYDQYQFDVLIDADIYYGTAPVSVRILCPTTLQAWWGSETVTLTDLSGDDAVYIPFDQRDFGGKFDAQTALDFTVEIWDADRANLLASEASVSGEPVLSEVIPPSYVVYSGIANPIYDTDQDNDGYFERYQFDFCVDPDLLWGQGDVYVKLRCPTTGQYWWGTTPLSISGDSIDDAVCYPFTQDDFFPHVIQRKNLDFTVELWDLSQSQLLASEEEVFDEPVLADHVFTLGDAVSALKTATGTPLGAGEVHWDLSGNGAVGAEDAVYIVQRISGARPEEEISDAVFNGGGPSDDGGAIISGTVSGDQGTATVQTDGTTTLSSPELRSDFTVKVVQKGTEIPVSGMNIQWRANNGRIELIAYDPSGTWAPVIYQGDPSLGAMTPSAAGMALPMGDDERRPQVFISGTLLLIGVVSLAVAELDYIMDVYRMSEFHITNIADNGDGYGIFRCTVNELSQYLSDYYAGKKATLSIATTYVFAGLGFAYPTEAWEAFGFTVGTLLDEQTQFVIDMLNSVEDDRLYGVADGNTEIWVQLNNWESVGNDFLYDVDVVILPIDWDDVYEDNDTLDTARTLEIKETKGLVVYENDPDYFKVYLNPGDSWQADVHFMNRKGDVNLHLYDPNRQLVDTSQTTGNSETVAVDDVSLPGWYFLSVTSAGGEWSANMYNLTTSGIGGEPQEERDLRFVLTWGESPTDLDSHLFTPDIGGQSYHVYYSNKMDALDYPFVGLDVDDTTSYGPETISINELYSGTYRYSVYNFSGSPAITTSQAQVALFDQFGLLHEAAVPANGSGLWWHVFEIDGDTGNVTLVNQIDDTAPAGVRFDMTKGRPSQ